MRRYIVEIDESRETIEIYQTLPEAAAVRYKHELGRDTAKRVEAVGYLAAILELLPFQPPTDPPYERGN